ncbi:MAG: hypothetical protein ACO250_07275 [Burkholderiaceae bacterium]
MTVQALFSRRSECDASVVRLRGTTSHQAVRPLCECVCQQEFEFPSLVATWSKAQHVIALNPNFRPTQYLGQSRQVLYRRGMGRINAPWKST